MTSTRIAAPGGFAPVNAVGYAEDAGDFAVVSAQSPLPVALARGASPATLAGSTGQSTLAGPFAPLPGLPVVIALAGEWQGSVQVLRSTDGGTTKYSLTAAGLAWARFTANACEPVWEEVDPAAELYLDIALTGGTLTYELGQ